MATTDGLDERFSDSARNASAAVRRQGSFAGRRRFYFLARTKTTLSSHVPLSTIETWSRSATPSPLSPKAMFAVARGWFSSAMIRRLRSIGEFQGALRVSETRSVAARTVARVVGQVFPVGGGGRQGAALCFFPLLGSPFLLRLLLFKLPRDGRADGTTAAITFVFDDRPTRGPLPSSLLGFPSRSFCLLAGP